MYFKKVVLSTIFYDLTNPKPDSLANSGFTFWRLFPRVVLPFVLFPLSLFVWTILKVLSIKFKVSIYVLKSFRPGWASTYISMIEPLCRELQNDKLPRRLTILVDPGEDISKILVESYRSHFTLYLNDNHRILRQVFFLVPRFGLSKKFLNTSDKFKQDWKLPPSKNFAFGSRQVPGDLIELGIDTKNYVLFAHASTNYYKSRMSAPWLADSGYRFVDLNSYESSILDLLQRGFTVVRVGINTDQLPEKLKKLPIIDYTGKVRNEDSELWLYENCSGLISSCSGAFWFAQRFGRPSLLTNNYVLPNGYQSTLFTPQLIINTETNSFLTISELLRSRHMTYMNSEIGMLHENLQFVPNSPQTLRNAVHDLLDVIAGASFSTSDIDLYARYFDLLSRFNMPSVDGCTKPAVSFLREFEFLLE